MKMIDNYEELLKICYDPNIEVEEIYPGSQNIVLVSMKKTTTNPPPLPNCSLPIGIFTTSYARTRMLQYLTKLGINSDPARVLYMDTDSIIYVRKVPGYGLPTGDFTGELKNEITSQYGAHAKATLFLANGPKSYLIKIVLPNGGIKFIQRLKGMAATWRVTSQLDPDKIIQDFMEQHDSSEFLVDVGRVMRKNRMTGYIENIEMSKKFRYVLNKRWTDTVSWVTYPYGYKSP